MSPRAAWRLESLGFTQVFDYVAGKVDWLANVLPVEGNLADLPRAGDVARSDVPTCRLTEIIGDVRARVQASDHTLCVVTNDEGVVLGRLGARALRGDPKALVEEAMESGPTTTRSDDPLEAITERLQEARVGSILVTTPDGRLVGLLYRKDAEQRLGEAPG
ncbi:MAG: CBS domain-containing protein [Chloroflexi bacterium]|nr:CBS domain-containing protein [Chloroflexota bacterium]